MLSKDNIFWFTFYVAPTPLGIILALSPISKWLVVHAPGFPVALIGFYINCNDFMASIWLLFSLKDGYVNKYIFLNKKTL